MLKDLFRGLRSEDKIQIQHALEGLAPRLAGLQEPDFEESVHAVMGLFYIDPLDHPELMAVLEQAEDCLADQRERVIPVILRSLAESDLKTHFRLASVLGKMGHVAVQPLLVAYSEARDDYARIFILYALGKVRDPQVTQALPVVFDALDHANPEVRDTAARTLGKVCEHVGPNLLTEATRRESFERLMARVSDRFAGVRSKAIRSLGKMARFRLLSEEQKARLKKLLSRVLGDDEAGTWDVAYVVRAEAEKAREHL